MKKYKIIAITVGVLTVIGSTSLFITNAMNMDENDSVSCMSTDINTTTAETTTVTKVTTDVTTILETTTTTATTTPEVTTTPEITTETTTATEVEETTVISEYSTAEITTMATPLNHITVNELTVETISVSCLKVEWKAEEGRQYKVDCYGEGNPYYSLRGNNVCYITGLRENSEYYITVTPLLSNTENEHINEYECSVAEIYGHTQAVEVIWEFEREEGWTYCFAGERASGLTRQPSSGAIYGSKVDEITNTGIRRFDNGDYCCAMGLWYGVVGDRFLVELENGQQFTVRICDSKGWADDADNDGICDGRFHWFGGVGWGKCIIEFIYDDDNLPPCVAYSGSWGYYNWEGMDLCSNILSINKINY